MAGKTCDRYCIGCIWLQIGHKTKGTPGTCGYALDDRNGLRGCPPGKGCTRKQTRRKRRNASNSDIKS